MDKSYCLPPYISQKTRAMMFIDGENLAIRYGKILGSEVEKDHVVFERNVFVWSDFANIHHHSWCEVIRRYYYTSVRGDEKKREDVEDKLRSLGIEAPRVFPRKKDRAAKRVDISLATDMLTHAHRKNYDIAILVAGDEDYVPLVEAVISEGRRVVLWFFKDGLSPALERSVDHSFDLSRFLFNTREYLDRY